MDPLRPVENVTQPAPVRILGVLGNMGLHGQERANVEVFRTLQSAGANVLVATNASWGGQHVQPLLDELGIPWRAIPFARHLTRRTVPWYLIPNVRLWRASVRAFGTLLNEYRPTHVHLCNPHYAFSVLPALRATNARVIYRLGDAPTVHSLYHRIVWRRVAARVDEFVCVSDYVRRTLRDSGAVDRPARVVFSRPPERPPSNRRMLLPDFDGRTAVCVGQMTQHKGVHLLVEAALQLCKRRQDVRFVLAGEIARDNPFAMDLLEQVSAADMNERLVFTGYVDDVPNLLAQGDVHVCPTISEEPLSNTVAEAKQAGVPSIVFDSGGLPEIVTHGVDGTICARRSARALEAAIEHYLDMDEPSLRGMGEAARRSMVRLGMTEERFTEQWENICGLRPPV